MTKELTALANIGHRFHVYTVDKRGDRAHHSYHKTARPVFDLLNRAIGVTYQVIQVAGSGKEYDVTPYMLKELAHRRTKPPRPEDLQRRLL